MPSDKGVIEPGTLLDLVVIDFDQLLAFKSGIRLAETDVVIRKYLFRQGYSIYPLRLTLSVELLPVNRVAIYMDHLEVGLRMPTARFFRDNLRY